MLVSPAERRAISGLIAFGGRVYGAPLATEHAKDDVLVSAQPERLGDPTDRSMNSVSRRTRRAATAFADSRDRETRVAAHLSPTGRGPRAPSKISFRCPENAPLDIPLTKAFDVALLKAILKAICADRQEAAMATWRAIGRGADMWRKLSYSR